MISKLVAKVSVVGTAAALALTATPSFAASAPTLSGPADRTGYGTITLTGTATPGAVVHLYESAIIFNDLEPADDWEHGGGTVTAAADTSGHYTITRYLDTGFYFETESGGVRSNKITVHMRVLPNLWLDSPSAGSVRAHVDASPNEPTLPVQIQRASGGTWTTVATGKTGSTGAYVGTVAGMAKGTYTFRAYIGADPANGMLANYSTQRAITIAGGTATTPAAGSVQFTRIQYNSPGTDTGSNASLNGEWVRLTNKTSKTINLRTWTVRDASAHVYTFSTDVDLGAGKSVTVHTGKGTATSTDRYWGRTGNGGYIWNNGGDTATVRTGAGKTIDTCQWGAGSGVTSC